jgi:hypothetical protein
MLNNATCKMISYRLHPQILMICLILLISCGCYTAVGEIKKSELVYVHQFPPGSEHLVLPQIVIFSIYMGKLTYDHLPLLLESMKFNPSVQFIMIHIVTSPTDSDEIISLRQLYNDRNFMVVKQTLAEFKKRVYERLGIQVPFTEEWYYKICDYKPTIAYLYPEYVVDQPYKYWGYADMDVVWGNISRFAYWFQGDYPFIISGKCNDFS